MAWKDRLLSFVRKYGPAAKVITSSVLNVAVPGSGALVELLDLAFDTAQDTADKDREEKLLQATQRNATELERLGALVDIMATDLSKVCDKALAFADQPDEIEEIVRRAISGDRTLATALHKLDSMAEQFLCLQEQNRRLLDGQDEMLPILRRMSRMVDFWEECWTANIKSRDIIELVHKRQQVVQQIQHHQTQEADELILELRTAVPKGASVAVLEAAGAVVDGDFPAVQKALATAVKLCPQDGELVELHRKATVIATKVTPGPGPDKVIPPSRLQPGDVLDGWHLESRLGAGGWGQVFKATKNGQTRALKVMHAKYSQDQRFVAQFKREIGNLFRLPRHANLVRIDPDGFSFAVDRACWYLVMEYIDGPTLENHLKNQGPLTAEQAQRIFAEVADGLGKAHAEGLCHRDIKPGNMIFRKADKKLVLVDFGLAVGTEDVGKTTIGGLTLMFAAPEQLRGRSADARSDVYSLAAVINFALLHDKPELRDPDRFDADQVPVALRAALLKAMDHNPIKRHQHASQMRDELVQKPKQAPPPPPPAETPAQRVRRLKQEAADKHEDVANLLQLYDYEEAAKILEGFTPDQIPFRNPAVLQDVIAKRNQLRHLKQQIDELYNAHRFTDPRFAMLIGQYLHIKPNDAEKIELAEEFPSPKIGATISNSLGMTFAWVPPGTSWLGGTGGTQGTQQFTLSENCYCGIYPVTQAEWQAVMGNNPSAFSRTGSNKANVAQISDADLKRFPVESVSWNDVQTFLQKLNQQLVKDGLTYRLPTEQEWEYICRGGPISQAQTGYDFYFAKSKTDLTPQPRNDLSSQHANFSGGPGRTSQVGLYLPNPLGIYDLHGNVWEWTSSLHENGSHRLIRGGSWSHQAAYCRAAFRYSFGPGGASNDLGFRLLAVSSQ